MSDTEKIESDEHVQWLIREERKEIYQMVAKDMLSKTRPGEGFFLSELDLKADVIYQGMIKFCGEAK